MSKLTRVTRAALIGLAIAGLGASAASAAQGDASAQTAGKAIKPIRQCFYLSDWRGWTAPDKNTLYMKVRGRDVYRVDLAYGSNQLTWPGTHLVSVVRGPDSICHPLDLDLRVSDGMGFAIPIRAKTITKLTPDEIKALPKKYQP
ncbi:MULTISPECIES: DUF6491 family protein [unclassified Caulobacter]|jgi:hypothetical protein|uniref:DUF6491 family protein n=1 Tax=unclassified Caulobacter TaxID=2648921 RepID=UPI0007011E8D|nr:MULTISPECIES: DUF6491 family protein [unclassified Caulobacter]KQV62476.1 hypothetical protein ASC62_02775 [Caulobacter sp. Root342]KQV65514.1 hypothetical protein ASC70_17525 [Caulobacter sp. Root343]